MDLRPTLAKKLVRVMLDELGMTPDSDRRRDLEKKVLEALKPKTVAENDVVGFVTKYPNLSPALAYLKEVAKQVWPGVKLTQCVETDPESCWTCWEGQTLVLNIFIPETAEYNTDRFDEIISAEGNPYSNLSVEDSSLILPMLAGRVGDL